MCVCVKRVDWEYANRVGFLWSVFCALCQLALWSVSLQCWDVTRASDRRHAHVPSSSPSPDCLDNVWSVGLELCVVYRVCV